MLFAVFACISLLSPAVNAVASLGTGTNLNCDFKSPCCWDSYYEDAAWDVIPAPTMDINEFRRTFLVGRGNPPPAGSYLQRVETEDSSSSFASCPICSRDGIVTIQYRHWQSPSADVQLCWRKLRGESEEIEYHCRPVESHHRQRQISSQEFDVPIGEPIQFMFSLANDGQPYAVMLIDRIRVIVSPCAVASARQGAKGELSRKPASEKVAVIAAKVEHESGIEPEEAQEKPSISSKKMRKLMGKKLPRISLLKLAELDDRVRDKIREKDQALRTIQIQKLSENKKLTPTETIPPRPIAVENSFPEESEQVWPHIPNSEVIQGPIAVEQPEAWETVKPQKPAKLHKSLARKKLPPASQISQGIATSLGKDANPLTDLIGEELANFLDPNYVTKDEDELDDEDTVDVNETTTSTSAPSSVATVLPQRRGRKRNRLNVKTMSSVDTRISPANFEDGEELRREKPSPSAVLPKFALPNRRPLIVNTPSPFRHAHQPLPLGIHHSCTTVGGCLFDKGLCQWKHTKDVSEKAHFQTTKVHHTSFIQAKVPSGEVSIIEHETHMSEPYNIVFDALEWTLGTRLIGCCLESSSQRLDCPFSTPSEAGAVAWQLGKFECQAGTDKLVFVCENYGLEEGVCGIDNVRLHRTTDVLLLEPCQREILSSL